MTAFDIVVVSTRSYTLDQESLDLLDPREGDDIAVGGRHLAKVLVSRLRQSSNAFLVLVCKINFAFKLLFGREESMAGKMVLG